MQLVGELVKEKCFLEQNSEIKKRMLQEIFIMLKKIYDVSGNIVIADKPAEGRSCYYKKNSIIFLNKPYLVNFLHEFRHLLQDKKLKTCPDRELDAELWSGRLLFRSGVKEKVYKNELYL